VQPQGLERSFAGLSRDSKLDQQRLHIGYYT
jgi:hypothetical protein